MSARDPEERRPLDPFFMGVEQQVQGFTDAIRPAIRWSSYDLQQGGTLALLDRGTPGREVQGNIVSIQLLNAHEAYRGYPNPSLSGRPTHRFAYAMLVGEDGWPALDVPRRAWEFNAAPWVRPSHLPADTQRSWLETSANVIVESVRREGDQLEVRFVDWTGQGGDAEVRVNAPHRSAARTDLLGERPQPLPVAATYRLPMAPQEIVTLRLQVESTVEAVPPDLDYRRLAPPAKRASFDIRHDRRGEPE
jgi:alpha-mannosidase